MELESIEPTENKSIGKVTFDANSKTYQTAWLFTAHGHLLTTGHGFSENGFKNGDIFDFKFSNSNVNYHAKLIEFKYELDKFMDYAILKIIGEKDEFQEINYLKISSFNEKKHLNKDFLSLGFTASFSRELIFNTRGRITGLVSHGDAKNAWAQLWFETGMDYEGISGAPIICEGQIIGIISQQSNESPQVGLGTILSNIDSTFVKYELASEKHSHFFKPASIPFSRLVDLKWTSTISHRNVLVIYDHLNSVQDNLHDDLFGYKTLEEFASQLLDLLKKTKIYPVNISHIGLKKASASTLEIESIQSAVSAIESREQSNQFSDLLRVVVDVDDNFVTKTTVIDDKSFLGKASHCVAIVLSFTDQKDLENVHFSFGPGNFDVIYNIVIYTDLNRDKIEGNVKKKVKGAMLNIINDILIDINFFYSVRALVQLIKGVDSKKAFSFNKVQFASANGLLPYSSSIIENTSYVSFASCARQDPWSDLDIYKYLGIWRQFLEQFFGGLGDDSNSADIKPQPHEEILSNIMSLKKIYGQLSKQQVNKSISQIKPFSVNTLCAFVIVTKKPNNDLSKRALEAIFGRPYKRNMFIILPANELQPLMKYQYLCRFYYFIKEAEYVNK